MSDDRPIGIFDSGIGGISIWKEIQKLLPDENTIYLADAKNAPYGPKGAKAIQQLSVKNTELLIKRNCKLIVVACNTATTNAINLLRNNYPIPFIGIEPAIKPASLNTKTKRIGILATKGTLSSALFHETSKTFANDVKIIEQEGHGIVELIEKGGINSTEMKNLLEHYIQPMVNEDIDHLVLGCTHYHFLTPILKELLPEYVTIIDSGYAVAKQTKSVLLKNELAINKNVSGSAEFFTNSKLNPLEKEQGFDNKINFLDF
jgi:glutamate racemase